MSNFRLASTQMHRMREGFQTQAPLNRTQETTQRREAIPVPKVPQALLSQWLLQSTHKPQVLLLQASCSYKRHSSPFRCVTLFKRTKKWLLGTWNSTRPNRSKSQFLLAKKEQLWILPVGEREMWFHTNFLKLCRNDIIFLICYQLLI